MDAFEVLIDELNSKVTQLKEWIGAGNAQDFSGYQKVCGEIRGLLTAKQHAIDLKHRVEQSDDD